MPLGLLDLSIVTDRLLQHLTESRDTSQLWIDEPTPPLGTPPAATVTGGDPGRTFSVNFTGMPPDAAQKMPGCNVSVYLFHVSPDKFHRNTFPISPPPLPSGEQRGPRAEWIPQQPLALTLYYLLSAHSDNYIEEQQAMSIALKCLHENAFVSALVPGPVIVPIAERTVEFTLSMEPQGVDEIGRLWQALSTPLRLSAVYRASVIFLEPALRRKAAQAVITADVKAYPQSVISRAVVDANGLATITGGGFAASSIVVRIDGIALHNTAASPPESGGIHVNSETTLSVQLPSGTASGQYRLRVQLNPDQQPAVFTLVVPADVP